MTKMGKKQICAKNYNERVALARTTSVQGVMLWLKGLLREARLAPPPAATRWHFTAAQSAPASASASQSFGCQLASCYLLQFKWLGIAIYCCLLEAWTRPKLPFCHVSCRLIHPFLPQPLTFTPKNNNNCVVAPPACVHKIWEFSVM